MVVRVQREDFNLTNEMKVLLGNQTDCGGCVSFIGKVRNKNNGLDIKSLEIEHYPKMTEIQLESIELNASEKWPINSRSIAKSNI